MIIGILIIFTLHPNSHEWYVFSMVKEGKMFERKTPYEKAVKLSFEPKQGNLHYILWMIGMPQSV